MGAWLALLMSCGCWQGASSVHLTHLRSPLTGSVSPSLAPLRCLGSVVAAPRGPRLRLSASGSTTESERSLELESRSSVDRQEQLSLANAVTDDNAEALKLEAAYEALTLDKLRSQESSAKVATILLFSYFTLGVLFFERNLDWNFVDAFYFVTVTLASVGFGDLVPETDEIKLFTAFYILVGIGVLGYALGEIVNAFNTSKGDANQSAYDRLIGSLVQMPSAILSAVVSKVGIDKLFKPQEEVENDKLGVLGAFMGNEDPVAVQLAKITSSILAFVAFGTLVFHSIENMSWVDAFYFAVVTSTTVGYGDITALDEVGKIFSIPYILGGLVLVSRSLGSLAAIPLEQNRKLQQQMVREQYGEELDAGELQDLKAAMNDLGLVRGAADSCTLSDFTLAMLVRQDKVSVEDVIECVDVARTLDADGSGELDDEDVRLFLEKKQRERQERERAARERASAEAGANY